MNIEVIEQPHCQILKHNTPVFNADVFNDAYEALEDIINRHKSSTVICDMSSINSCALIPEQFAEILRAMLQLLSRTPKEFQIAIVTQCEELARNVKNCQSGFEAAGLSHTTFLSKSRREAIDLLGIPAVA